MIVAAIILFFSLFGVVSGFVEHRERENRQLAGNPKPLEHHRLVTQRVVVGIIYLFAVSAIEIATGHFHIGHTLLYCLMAMGAFAIPHRITINYADNRGPWYMGVDSQYDRFFLRRAGMEYVYEDSALHYEAWSEILNYRSKVRLAATFAYCIELITVLVTAYITT